MQRLIISRKITGLLLFLFAWSLFPEEQGLSQKTIYLKYLDPEAVVIQVRPLLSPLGRVETDTLKKEITLFDDSETISRIAEIIKDIDKPVNKQKDPGTDSSVYMEVVEIKAISGKQMLLNLKEIFGDQLNEDNRHRAVSGKDQSNKMLSENVKIQVMPGDKSLMIIASADDHHKIGDVIRAIEESAGRLNMAQNKDEYSSKMIYLHNIPSSEAMSVLNSVTGDSESWGSRKKEKKRESVEVDIIEIKSSNAVHVMGKNGEIQKIITLIEELDKSPSQVLIEVMILEVTLKNGKSIGFELSTDRGDVLMQNNYDLGNQMLGGSTGFFTQYSSAYLTAVLKAVEETSNVKVLSSPHILVANNHKAFISIGDSVVVNKESIEIPTGSVSTPIVRTTHEYVDVGLKLEIKPNINESNFVSLEIKQDVNDIKDSGVPGFPEISKRNLTTTIISRDKESIVLGGLISRKTSHSEMMVPVLAYIPVLGRFFRKSQNELKTTELVLFLTPYIVHTQNDLTTITNGQKEKLKEIKKQFLNENENNRKNPR